MSYTQLVLLAMAAAISLDLFGLRTRLLLRKGFWAAYAIVVFFQLITNAWLTSSWMVGSFRLGAPIVNYDEEMIIGLRIAYAPVEDLGFGFALVVMTLSMWIYWGRRGLEPSERRL
jgi:lycopene cyclase domain-containing protein